MKLDDFDINEDINTDNKPKKKHSSKKKAASPNGLTAFLTLIIGLLLGALIMMLIVHYTDDVSGVAASTAKENEKEVIQVGDNEKVRAEDSPSEEEIDLIAEEVAADIKDSETDESILQKNAALSSIVALKQSLQNGDSVSKALRKTFTNELVCARDGKYYFTPIDEHLNKNDYIPESLVIRDDGRYEYCFEDGTKAKTGIDVSKYQGEVDWDMVASDGIDFAIIRAGIRGYESGKLVLDEDFALNITQAIDAGLDVGVYFFSQAVTTDEAEEEINAIVEALDGNPLNYPIVYDLEYVKGGRREGIDISKSTDIARAFCERALECGYTPMIYGNLDTFLLQLELSRIEDTGKWFAYYDTDFYFPYNYDMWQYTDSGTVEGIAGDVDLNLDMRH